MPNKKLKDSAFKSEAYAPKKAKGPSFKGRGKAPMGDAANTAKPGGSMNVLKKWAGDNHKTGLRT